MTTQVINLTTLENMAKKNARAKAGTPQKDEYVRDAVTLLALQEASQRIAQLGVARKYLEQHVESNKESTDETIVEIVNTLDSIEAVSKEGKEIPATTLFVLRTLLVLVTGDMFIRLVSWIFG